MPSRRLAPVCTEVLEEFVKSWQRTPHRWWYESDVAAELAHRLAVRLEAAKLALIKYDDCPCEKGNRVRIDYPLDDGMHPRRADVAVLSDLETWPLEWICEIKAGETEGATADIEKVARLLKQGRVEDGCCLQLKIYAKKTPPVYSGPQSVRGVRVYRVFSGYGTH
jgi:hypothetical protein